MTLGNHVQLKFFSPRVKNNNIWVTWSNYDIMCYKTAEKDIVSQSTQKAHQVLDCVCFVIHLFKIA